jgi:hypothetical protein
VKPKDWSAIDLEATARNLRTNNFSESFVKVMKDTVFDRSTFSGIPVVCRRLLDLLQSYIPKLHAAKKGYRVF